VGFCLRPRSPPRNLVPFNGGVLGHCFRAMMNVEAFITKGKSVIAMTQDDVSIVPGYFNLEDTISKRYHLALSTG
jgi:hypothetical protein